MLKVNRFSMFWFDTLNLSNGIIFLMLFRSMIKVRVKQYREINSKTVGEDRQSDKDVSVVMTIDTANINRILHRTARGQS